MIGNKNEASEDDGLEASVYSSMNNQACTYYTHYPDSLQGEKSYYADLFALKAEYYRLLSEAARLDALIMEAENER